MRKSSILSPLMYLLYGGLIIFQGYFIMRAQTVSLLVSFGLMVVICFYLMRTIHESTTNLSYRWSILLRVLLLFAIPALSDDVYRFIWDGRLLMNGVNPYMGLPIDHLDMGLPGITLELFEKLNSPKYFTVYPPLNQAVFFLSTILTPHSEWWSVVIIRMVILAFEVGNIALIRKLLKHYKLPQKYGLFYALNPMIILELTGNLHFEAIMIFFLLLALWHYEKGQLYYGAVFLGLSISTKLLPLIFLPLLVRKMGFKKALVFGAIVGATIAITFLPLINTASVNGLSDSLALYFQKFEFNGSVYYITRWIGFLTEGYNIIAKSGKWMSIATFLSIMIYAWFSKKQRLPEQMTWTWLIYLLFATTIHPWYSIPLLAVSIFTHKRFPFVWTIMIFFTYANYTAIGYQEQLWVVALEYAVVFGVAIYEMRGRSLQKVFF